MKINKKVTWAVFVPAIMMMSFSSAQAHDVAPRAQQASIQMSNWSNNCEAHHSVNDRELSECKAKVLQMRRLEIPSGRISIDSGNAGFSPFHGDRQSFDRIGKDGASDSLS